MPMGAAIGLAGTLGSGSAWARLNAFNQAAASQLQANAVNIGLQNTVYTETLQNYAARSNLGGFSSALANAAPTSRVCQFNSRGETFPEWLAALERRENELTGPMTSDERLAWEVDLREWEVLRASIR